MTRHRKVGERFQDPGHPEQRPHEPHPRRQQADQPKKACGLLVAVLLAFQLVFQDEAQLVLRHAFDRQKAAALDERVLLVLQLLFERDISLFLLNERIIVEALDRLLDVALAPVDQQPGDLFQIEMLALDRVGNHDGERDQLDGCRVQQIGEAAVQVDRVDEDEEDGSYQEERAAFCGQWCHLPSFGQDGFSIAGGANVEIQQKVRFVTEQANSDDKDRVRQSILYNRGDHP